MASKPYYRFSLRKRSTGEYYFINDSGVIDVSATAKYIEDPIDWAKIELKVSRNKKYGGLFRDYSNQIQFPLNGAKILRQLYYVKGADAECQFYVENLDHTSLEYEPFYSNDLDFSQAQDLKSSFEIGAMESGVLAMIKANESVEYEIPIDGADVIETEVSPLLVKGQARFLTMWPIPAQAPSTAAFARTNYNSKHYAILVDKTIVPVANTPANEPVSIADSSSNQYVDGQRYQADNGSGTFSFVTSGQYNYLLRANVALYDVTVKAHLNFYVANNSGYNNTYKLFIWKQDASGVLIGAGAIYTLTSANINNGASLNFAFDIDTPAFDMAAGERLVMGFGFNATAGQNDHDVAWEKSQYINIDFNHYTDTFIAKGLRWYKVAEKLLKLMTNNEATLAGGFLNNSAYSYSTGFDNRPYNTCLYSGDSIRGINTSDYRYPVIKTKWTDLFQDGFSNWGISMGVAGSVVSLNKLADRYDTTTEIHDLGSVPDCSIDIASEYRYKTVSVGNKDFLNFDQLNGRDEFNTTLIFNLPTTTATGALNLVSPYCAGCYPIFNTWANYALLGTTDSKNDNETFVIEIAQNQVGGYYVPYKPSGTISGVNDSASMFNFGLSPKRKFKRNAGLIAASLFGVDTSVITFQTAQKNGALFTNFGNGVFDEDADLSVGALGNPIFYPFSITVKTPVPENLISLLDTNPNGYFSFNWRGSTFKGFPIDIKQIPSIPIVQTMRLLASPDNNMLLMGG